MKRLLVFRLSAMGDVAMTIPIIYSLAKEYPNLQITVVSRESFRAFFEYLPENVSFFPIDLKEKHKGIIGLLRLFKTLKKMDFDAVADLHNVLRTIFIRSCFLLCGIPVASIDKGRKDKRALIRTKNKVFEKLPSTFDRYYAVFEKLNLPFSLNFKSIFENKQIDKTEYVNLTGEKGNNKWVGIAAFAKHKGKIYPLEKVEKLIDILSKKKDIKIFLFGGGEAEEKILSEWENKFPNTISLAGKIRLTIISQLDVMFSMDSSNMHIASLVNVPVVSIWGATHYYLGFMGWKQSKDNAVELNLPCRPCSTFGQKPCFKHSYECLNNIEIEQILQKVAPFLE